MIYRESCQLSHFVLALIDYARAHSEDIGLLGELDLQHEVRDFQFLADGAAVTVDMYKVFDKNTGSVAEKIRYVYPYVFI